MRISYLLSYAVMQGASDLHITVGVPPLIRVNGELQPIKYDVISPEDSREMMYEVMSESQRERFEQHKYVGFSMSMEDTGRVRANIYHQRGYVEGCFRIVPFEVPRLEDLGLPDMVMEFCRKPRGLILVTGPSGSGKTTTFNAMIDFINRERRVKIVTVEDPIEYIHGPKKGFVVQQEVETDAVSFHEALYCILRMDPNVIGVGELRSLETIQMALTAAETGHLVIGTLHTQDAPQTIERLIDVFPPHQHAQVRMQMSMSLQGVICQLLLPRVYKEGRVLACEVMIGNQGVKNLIRENKIEQLHTLIQTGSVQGMQTMDKSLRDLYEQGIITYNTAVNRAKHPRDITEKKRKRQGSDVDW